MITKDREYRSFVFERSEDENFMLVTGQPVIFNSPTVLYTYEGIDYKEKIDVRALEGALMNDVVFNIDHSGKPAAKTKNGTLKLELKSDGLYMQADLSKNATGRELYEDIINGFYDKMSFAFTVGQDDYDTATHTRTIKKIDRLYDVSAVTFPAYKDTSIKARSYFEAEAEKERKARELVNLRKQKLILLTKI